MTSGIDVTVAAVAEDRGRFLTVEERVAGRVVLNQPAGHLEPGEPLLEAVVRETFEETGYRFVPEAIVGIYSWLSPADGTSVLRICFSGRTTPPQSAVRLDEGIIGTHWLTPTELLGRADTLRSPLVMRAIDDYQRGCRYALECVNHITEEPAGVVESARFPICARSKR